MHETVPAAESAYVLIALKSSARLPSNRQAGSNHAADGIIMPTLVSDAYRPQRRQQIDDFLECGPSRRLTY